VFGLSMMVIATILISGVLVGFTAQVLGRVDRERGRAEEALRKAESMAAVGRLSSQVAHEINNPLTSLLGYLERVKAKVGEDPKAAEAAERVERAALRIRDLAKDLLSLARAGRMEMGAVRLPAVLEESRKMLEPDLEKHGVRVEWRVPDSLPEIRGSGEHLHQAFSNMLINARQAMPSGGVLTVEAAPVNGEVRVSVADTGVGIPQENLQKIFEPFFTTKPKGEGTGLGLAICQSVVSQHGGRIEVRSEAGKGSTFVVTLPAGRGDGRREVSPAGLPANGARGGAA
jgi:two-component system NtrC family sensor kinase